MKASDKITTKDELLSALVEQASEQLPVRRESDFSLQEFIQRYEKDKGIKLSEDTAAKVLRSLGYAPIRIRNREFVWRKPD